MIRFLWRLMSFVALIFTQTPGRSVARRAGWRAGRRLTRRQK